MDTPNLSEAVLLHRAQRSEEHAARLTAPEQAHQRRALLREAEILRGFAERSMPARTPAPAPATAAP